MTTQAKVILSAEDRTAAAFATAQRGLDKFGLSAEVATKYLNGLAAAFSVGAIASSIQATANFADEQGKLAQRAGETAEEFSRLSYAARQADVDNNELAKGLRQLGADALSGGEKLAALGIAARDNQGNLKTNAELFRELAEVISRTEDPQKRVALAAQVLGEKLGPQLVPLLAQGRSGLKDLGDEAERFGRVVDDKAVQAAETFNDNLTRLTEAGAGLAQRLAGPVIQSLATTSSYFIKVANDVGIARAALITFGSAVARTLGVDDVGKLQSQAQANQNAIALTVKQIETFQRFADRGDAAAASRVASLRDQFSRLQTEGRRISSALTGEAAGLDASFTASTGSPLPPVPTLNPPSASRARRAISEAEKAQQDYDAFQRQSAADLDRYLQNRHTERLRAEEAAERRYLQDMADLEEAQAEGIYRRNLKRWEDEEKAREDLAKRAADAQEAQAQRLGDAFASSIDGAFREGMKFGDLLKKLAFDAINLKILTPAAQSLGNTAASFVSSLFSFDGGGYTGAGSRSGGLDGRGGFMAMLHPNETVLDHTRGQGMGGGTAVINQSFNFGNASADTVAQLRAEAQRIKAETLAAVPAAMVQAVRTSTGVARAMRGA